jgi:ribosomal protein S18 acetylase RimI-like enzyme
MTNSVLIIRRLQLHDMDAAARVHRAAFDHALPWLTGLHTPEEDRCQVHGSFEGGDLTGIIAFRTDWIDQLYVLPEAQRLGVDSELLQIAKRAFDRLQLWTFQRNAPARRFYEARGFALVEQTDGAGNEEKEPDARYLWTRA